MRRRSSSARRSSGTGGGGGRSSGTAWRSTGTGTGRRGEKLRFDEFGFAISKKKEQKVHHRCHDYRYPQLTSARVKELCELLSYWNGASFICRSQIERFVRMGVPPSLRGRVWKCLLAVDSLRGSSDFDYQTCLSEVRGPLVDLGVSEYGILSAIATLSETQNDLDLNQQQRRPGESEPRCSVDDIALFRQIALDLRRSFPTHRSLMGDSPEAIEGQARLFRVLIACAKYNPQVGYSQGMSYIAAVLLMQLGEEEAFWALTALLDKPKYLAELFDLSLTKVQHQVKVFEQLLRHRKPRLAQHLESVGVLSVHFVMPWFLTLFTSLPCWDSVLAVWDLIILHGLPAAFRAALTIVDLLEPRLSVLSDQAAVLPLLLRVPADLAQYPVLVPALWNTELQDWELKCMNSLVLDESHRDPRAGEAEELSATPCDRLEAGTQGGNVSAPCEGGNAAEKGPKSVLARVLRLAQRLLLDPIGRPSERPESGPQSPAAPRASRRTSLAQSQAKAKRRSQRKGGASGEDVGAAAKDATGSANTDGSETSPETSVVGASRRRGDRGAVHPVRLKSLRLLRGTPPPSPSSVLPPPSLRSASFAGRPASPAATPRTALIKELSSRHQSSVASQNGRESKLI